MFNHCTPRKFNIAPENKPSQKESSLPTIIFQGRAVKFPGCKCSQSWNITGAFPPPWFQNWHVVFFLRKKPYQPNHFQYLSIQSSSPTFCLAKNQTTSSNPPHQPGQFFPAWQGFDANFGVPNDLKVSLHSKHLWPKSFFSTCELFFLGGITTPNTIFVVWACHFFDVICSQNNCWMGFNW